MDHPLCTAGFARLDITPPLGVRIGGYYTVRVTKGVLDPIYVRAVAFGEGDKSAVMLVLDHLGMYGMAGHDWPIQIAEHLSLPREAVFLSHTHSHTTPVVDSYREPNDEQYDAWLFRRLCDAAQMALDDRKPVTDVRAAQTQTEGMAFVRRYRMKDGTVKTNPAFSLREEIAAPACESDESLRLIRILRQDAPELIFVNFQVHPDCIGGEKISADYPGAVCRRVEELAGSAHCIFTNGGEGQQTRTNRMKPHTPSQNRYADCMAYGAAVADAAMQLYDRAPSTGLTGLCFGQSFVHMKTKRDPSKMDLVNYILDKFEQGERLPLSDEIPFTAPEAFSIRDLERRKLDYIDLPVTALVFCGAAFLGLPGEPFNELGKHIRDNSKFPMTSLCCQTNGCFGYLPVASAYDEGGYEPHNTRLVRGVGELLMNCADKLLESL